MNSKTGKFLIVIATGFIVLVLYSVILFFGRTSCFWTLIGKMPYDWRNVTICPSGLIPGEGSPNQTKDILTYAEAGISNDPNMRLSAVQFRIEDHFVKSEALSIIGQFGNFPERQIVTKDGIYYYYINETDYLMFNKQNGQFVYSYPLYQTGPNNISEVPPKIKSGESTKLIIKSKVYFAGPNGVSETASAALGKFEDPIVERTSFYRNLGLYDAKKRRFYLIYFYNLKIAASPQLATDDKREPVAIGGSEYYLMGIGWTAPSLKDANDEWKSIKTFLPKTNEPNERWIGPWSGYTEEFLTVLDKSGKIYEVNTVDWSFRDIGFLPAPDSLFSDSKQEVIAAPKNLLYYQINPIYYTLMKFKGNQRFEIKEIKYFGMSVASLSREGTALATAVFGPNGKLIYRGYSRASDGSTTAKVLYRNAPIADKSLFLLENLQPVVFGIASFLCGDCIEASAGHRTLFILPNSLEGMLGRCQANYELHLLMPILMGPSLILAIWLMLSVRKDAKTVGLSGKAIQWWTIGTFLFGLPAYITYRLTRPRETMVTCQNCGKMRRPDMETCHRCGSKWDIPELMAPNWRICD